MTVSTQQISVYRVIEALLGQPCERAASVGEISLDAIARSSKALCTCAKAGMTWDVLKNGDVAISMTPTTVSILSRHRNLQPSTLVDGSACLFQYDRVARTHTATVPIGALCVMYETILKKKTGMCLKVEMPHIQQIADILDNAA